MVLEGFATVTGHLGLLEHGFMDAGQLVTDHRLEVGLLHILTQRFRV
jgi:hypothetical protein